MQASIVSINAGTIGIPNHAINVTLNEAAIVATAANDKSNMFAENANVTPIAMTVVIEIERRIVTILSALKNVLGAQIEKMINAITIEATAPQFAKNLPMVIF